MAASEVRSQSHIADTSAGYKVTVVGMIVNALLIVIKVIAGVVAKSQALVADGIHSLSDFLSDIAVLVGLKLGRKEEDEEHPFGHGRIETMFSMLVGIILIVVATGLAYSAIVSIIEHKETSPSIWTVLAAALSIVLKEGMYWYTVVVGRRIKSQVIIANAWHHRSDALSSVAVLIGVVASYLNPEWHMADAYAALVVTLFIGKVGVELIWSAAKEVVDTSPDKAIVTAMRSTAEVIPGVRQVHDFRARTHGSQIFVSVHIVVDPTLTVWQGHEIAATVKHTLLDKFEDVTRVIVHVDPVIKT